MRPFFSYIGGKYGLSEQFPVPREFNRYFEPFVGSGGFLFRLLTETQGNFQAFINDHNENIMGMYNVMKHKPELFLSVCEKNLGRAQFQKIENDFNKQRWINTNQKYLWFWMLSRYSYNDSVYIKKSGEIRTSYQENHRQQLCYAPNILEISQALQKVKMSCTDYREVLKHVKAHDFVYLDPPYFNTDTSTFYSEIWEDDCIPIFLHQVLQLDKKKAHVLISLKYNKSLALMLQKYGFTIKKLARKNRMVKGNVKPPTMEMIAYNYKPDALKSS